jgi:hypothetical protein
MTVTRRLAAILAADEVQDRHEHHAAVPDAADEEPGDEGEDKHADGHPSILRIA